MPLTDLRPRYQQQLQQLTATLADNTEPVRVKKKTISNLFRYDGRQKFSGRLVDLSQFNQPLFLDTQEQTLEVGGLCTYQKLVEAVLPQGFLPTITPELKHITVGGATVGIGIESNSFRYGFVHNGLLEADVLLPDGRVVTCTPHNQQADLLVGLANSYGSLGYILRAKIQLRPALPYVHLQTEAFDNIQALLAATERATRQGVSYIESLVYSPQRLFLTTSREVEAPGPLTSIYGPTIFYQHLSRPGELWLTTQDYIFRYDPEYFWGLPETRGLKWFRRVAPPILRNSAFYTRYGLWASKLGFIKPEPGLETLIQDWEVPWEQGAGLIEFAFNNIDFDGKPLTVTPVKVPAKAPLYPLEPGKLYLNLGSYNSVKVAAGQAPYHSTRLMDQYCFGHNGIKMLYSSTFVDPAEFDRLYGGNTYQALKHKYDPQQLFPGLYDKVVRAR